LQEKVRPEIRKGLPTTPAVQQEINNAVNWLHDILSHKSTCLAISERLSALAAAL